MDKKTGMESDNFEQIDKARKILNLGETATLKEIKEAYRGLVKRYHPDRYKGRKKKEFEERMKEINKAYKLIMEYCENYRYSFTKKGVEDFYSKYMRGFQEDWMWGPGKENKEVKKDDYRGI